MAHDAFWRRVDATFEALDRDEPLPWWMRNRCDGCGTLTTGLEHVRISATTTRTQVRPVQVCPRCLLGLLTARIVEDGPMH